MSETSRSQSHSTDSSQSREALLRGAPTGSRSANVASSSLEQTIPTGKQETVSPAPVLDRLLDDIVGQVRLTTRATGAAIALASGEAMICRATTGGNAPDLGTHLDTKSGLSGACVQSRQIQLCRDTESDERVNVEACRALGVRSILVLPLLHDDKLVGVFEVFSPVPHAFGDRDIQTLQAFTWSVLKVAEAAALPPADRPKSEQDMPPEASELQARRLPLSSFEPAEERPSTSAGRDWANSLLTVLVIALAILLGSLLGMHINRQRARERQSKPIAAALPPETRATPDSQSSSATDSGVPSAAGSTRSGSSLQGGAPLKEPKEARERSTPDGTLLVYRNDRVVFQTSPVTPEEHGSLITPRTAEATANSPQLITAVEISPEAANSLLASRVEPEYPPEVLAGHIQGPVVIRLLVNRTGAVQSTQFVSGPPELAPAALNAVKQWRYRPYSPAGAVVDFQTKVTINFVLP